jgi:hypothetical protein
MSFLIDSSSARPRPEKYGISFKNSNSTVIPHVPRDTTIPLIMTPVGLFIGGWEYDHKPYLYSLPISLITE